MSESRSAAKDSSARDFSGKDSSARDQSQIERKTSTEKVVGGDFSPKVGNSAQLQHSSPLILSRERDSLPIENQRLPTAPISDSSRSSLDSSKYFCEFFIELNYK